MRNILGWVAVVLATLLASLWAFWGSIENFHEGWYAASWWMNVRMMFVQYLGFAIVVAALAAAAIRFPRTGAALFLAIGIGVPVLLIRTFAALWIFGVPLGATGLLFFTGRPRPRKWALRTVVFVPLLVALGCAIEPALRVAGRIDDGDYGARRIDGNGVALVWAPAGPGWTTETAELGDATWEGAMRVCAHLRADGRTLSDTVQGMWRLPTVDEAVRSSVRHGKNAGGSWDPVAHEPRYAVTPDKESPLWKVHSPIIYWWTSTEAGPGAAYRIVYNGGVQSCPKSLRMGSLGFRAVRNVSAGTTQTHRTP